MLEEIKQAFEDIKDAIIEQGINVDYCDSPTTYANKILQINGGSGNTLLFVPVFKSSETKPAKPTKQMSATDPTDYPDGWTTPDELQGTVWMTYTLVGNSYTYVPWTEPILVTDTDASGGGFTYKNSRTFVIYAEIPSLSLEVSIPTGGRWDYQTNKLVGQVTSTLSDGSTVQWSTNNDHIDGMFTYISMGTFSYTGDIMGAWSDPFCINSAKDGKDGKDGRNGADGTNVEFIYKLCKDYAEFETLEIPYSDPTTTGYIPSGWTDSPTGISDTNRVEAVCTRKILAAVGQWSAWTAPIVWSIWGGDGTDGDGIEYIYRVAAPNEVSTPETSTDGKYHLVSPFAMPPRSEEELINGSSVSPEVLLEFFQRDDFVPGEMAQSVGWDRNWSDDPLDVEDSQPYEFCAIRKKQDGVWTYYSEPTLWNKWPYADVSVFTSFVFTRSSTDLSTCILSGGTKDNPIPTRTETQGGEPVLITWYDSVPSTLGDVWMASRLFANDGAENQGWSSPCKITDTSIMQIEFSSDYPWNLRDTPEGKLPNLNNYVVPISELNPEGIDKLAWRHACLLANLGTWNDIIEDASYMAICYKNNSSWTDWNVSKIKDEVDYNRVNQTITQLVDQASADLRHDFDEYASEAIDEAIGDLEDASTELSNQIDSARALLEEITDIPGGEVIENFSERLTHLEGFDQQLLTAITGDESGATVSEVAQTMDAINSSIENLATWTEFDPVLNLQEANRVVHRLNAQEATIKSIASHIDSTGTTTVNTDLDAIAGNLSQSVTRQTETGTLTTVQSTLNAQGQKVDSVIQQLPNDQGYGIKGTVQLLDTQGASTVTVNELTNQMAGISQTVGAQGSQIAAIAEAAGSRAAIIATVNNAGQSQVGIDASNIVLNGTQTTVNSELTNINSRLTTIEGDLDVQGGIRAKSLNTGDTAGINTEIKNGSVLIKNGTTTRAKFALNTNGDVVLEFYDANGNVLYNLGPAGFRPV